MIIGSPECLQLQGLYTSHYGISSCYLYEILESLFDQGDFPFVDLDAASGIAGVDVSAPIITPCEKITESEQPILKILQATIDRLKDQFRKYWDPSQKHVIFASAGKDSRILGHILKELDFEMDLGEFVFLCHEPENEAFLKAFRVMGWDDSRLMVWEKPYFMGNFKTRNMNGFIGPHALFHPHDWNPKEWTLITGSFGGELVDYPTQQSTTTQWRNSRYSHYSALFYHARWPVTAINADLAYWGNVWYPYLDLHYLQHIFSIPRIHFATKDKIRTAILEDLFGDHLTSMAGHHYSSRYSDIEPALIKSNFLSSTFYQLYSPHISRIKHAKPWETILDRRAIDSKIYGLASVFEQIEVNKLWQL